MFTEDGLSVVICLIARYGDLLTATVLPAKGDNDVMFCLQSYQGLRIDRSFVY